MKIIIHNKNNLKETDITEVVKRVKILIINSNNEILLGYSHNDYQFPSGHVEKGENLDHPTFLYGEELFIAERAARLGMKVIYDDRYQVLHAEHITTSKMTSEFRAKTLKESLISFIKYYY